MGDKAWGYDPAPPARAIRRENSLLDCFLIRLIPRQNASIDRYNCTVRHERLNHYIIESIEEAQDHATQWLRTCNNDRPNKGTGGITPARKLKLAAQGLWIHPVKNG